MKTKNVYPAGKHRLEHAGASSRFQAGMRSAALLLHRHRPVHAVRRGAVQIPATELVTKPLYSEGDTLPAQMERTSLDNDSLTLSARKPLMTGDQVRARIGLPLGPLQAVVYPSGDAPRILCFDRSYTVDGERHVQYLMATDAQVEEIQKATYDEKARRSAKEQTFTLKPGQRRVVGENHPMPGERLRPEMLHDDEGVVKNPALAGEVTIAVTKFEYPGLRITDLGGGQGTVVDHSAEFILAQDPWAGIASTNSL